MCDLNPGLPSRQNAMIAYQEIVDRYRRGVFPPSRRFRASFIDSISRTGVSQPDEPTYARKVIPLRIKFKPRLETTAKKGELPDRQYSPSLSPSATLQPRLMRDGCVAFSFCHTHFVSLFSDCETRNEFAVICHGYMALLIDYRSPLSTYRVYLLFLNSYFYFAGNFYEM